MKAHVADILQRIMESNESPLVIGPAGTGKTTIFKEIAKRTGRKLIELPLQVMQPEDFIGLIVQKGDRFDFALPSWWPEDGNTLLFLDEINRSQVGVRGALLKIVLEHTLNNHKLPDGVWIAAAMNPYSDNYEVEDIVDQAFLSRFIKLTVDVDSDEWLSWAKSHKVREEVVDFIANNRQFLITEPKQPGDSAINPRTWEKVSNLMKAFTPDEFEQYGITVLKNQLGSEASISFMNFIKEQKTQKIKAEDVLMKPAEFAATIKKLPDDKKNILFTKITDYVIEKLKNNVDYTKEYIKMLEILYTYINRENIASIIRYLYSMANEKNEAAQMLLEEVTNDPKFDDLYQLMKEM